MKQRVIDKSVACTKHNVSNNLFSTNNNYDFLNSFINVADPD